MKTLGSKFINKFSLIITILFITFFALDKDYVMFSIAVEIYCSILVLALSIIIFLIKGKYIDGIYKNFGVAYLILSIYLFLNVVDFYLDINSSYYWNPQYINISKNIFTYFIVILAFKLNKTNTNKYKAFIVYMITNIIIIFGTYYIFGGFILKYTQIYLVLMVILRMWTIYTIYTSKAISSREKKLLCIYIIITIAYQEMGYIIGFDVAYNNPMYAILKYLLYYIIYDLMNEYYFYNSYVKQKRMLENAKTMQKDLNKLLLAKNKNLKEFKTIIEKVEKGRRELIETIKDGIIMITADRITYINKANLDILKIAEEKELIGESIYVVIDILIKEFSNLAFLKEKYENISINEKINNKLHRVINVVHEGNEYEIYYIRLTQSNSVIYTKDISEIKENQRITMEYEEYLKEEKVKNQFYSNISHELRTPINTISSAIQLNEIYLRDENINSILKNIGIIKQNSLRLIRTINNFIDTNKITEGYLLPNSRLCNIVSVVENISLACKSYIELIDNTLIFDSEEEEIYCYVDIDMIERAVLNIISNYVKYGIKGGELFINIKKDNDKVIIELKNNLYSIIKEDLPFLFDKFTKLNKSLNREKEGSGLGLFLTRSLLQLNDGDVKVVSSEEDGTNFIITLNIAEGTSYYDIDYIYDKEDIKQKVATEFSDIYL